jgi:hypothetical protein
MIVKKTKQLGNFKKGTNLYVPKKRIVPAVPSGIVVATTNTINVVDNFYINQTIALAKVSSTEYRTTSYTYTFEEEVYCEDTQEYVSVDIYKISVIKESGSWFYRYYGLYNCDTNIEYDINQANVVEVTNGIIPTTGWSSNLTITAA